MERNYVAKLRGINMTKEYPTNVKERYEFWLEKVTELAKEMDLEIEFGCGNRGYFECVPYAYVEVIAGVNVMGLRYYHDGCGGRVTIHGECDEQYNIVGYFAFCNQCYKTLKNYLTDVSSSKKTALSKGCPQCGKLRCKRAGHANGDR